MTRAERKRIVKNVCADQDANVASRFLDPDANDWLSRASSDIYRTRRAHAEGAAYDAGFDAGEFSGPAHALDAEREVARVAEHFFNYAGVQLTQAIAERIAPTTQMRFGLFNLDD
jgi:hypothetical protein